MAIKWRKIEVKVRCNAATISTLFAISASTEREEKYLKYKKNWSGNGDKLYDH
jgi:hypothetical protein